ncbi:MAG TPA: hypothetical protein PLQ49_06550 [Methanothrix sp.]|nr:hypothetical protein [Methanothrix sp.]HRW82480.1 hypothetical protein [Methanothrix sp.]
MVARRWRKGDGDRKTVKRDGRQGDGGKRRWQENGEKETVERWIE